MFGHVAVKDTSPVVRNDEETVEDAEGKRRHSEEVHCGNRLTMIAQEGPPSLCRLRTPWRSPHPAQDASLRNIEAKHFQFPMDARRTPGWVLGIHAKDQFVHRFADALSARPSLIPREPRPIRRESGSVPSRNGLRLYEN